MQINKHIYTSSLVCYTEYVLSRRKTRLYKSTTKSDTQIEYRFFFIYQTVLDFLLLHFAYSDTNLAFLLLNQSALI